MIPKKTLKSQKIFDERETKSTKRIVMMPVRKKVIEI